MDFDFNEVQEMLRKDSRRFLTEKCTKAYVRKMEEDEKGFTPDLWKEMAGLGWMGLVFPEKYGGLEMSFLELTVLLEEMGRACLPGPFFSAVFLGGLPILEAGTEEQKQEFLPKIAGGDMIVTTALTEPSGTYDPAGIELKATAHGDHYILEGTKLFVTDAHVADYMIVAARTAADKTKGITLFLVDAKSPGLKVSMLKTIASDKQGEVVFDKVSVPKKNILGKLNEGWPLIERLMQLAAAGKCAEMVGGAQQVLEMTVEYAKQRVQFGKPIGSFQAVQHHCANMATDVEGSRFITYQVAWMLSENMACTKEIAMAKAWVSDAYRRVVSLGHQVHGGIGFTKDHDMQLYFRRGKAAEAIFGDADLQREMVACQLGLQS